MSGCGIFFSIPFASKTDDGMWELSVEILRLSLGSILNQRDGDFTVLLCCHDRPNIPELNDPRVEFIESTSPRIASIEEGIADKGRKRKQMFHEIGRRGGGYDVMIDADDFVSSRLVGHIRHIAAPHGYIFRTGYALDFESGNVAPIPGIWSKPFTFVCGICAAIYFPPDDVRKKLDGTPRYAHKFKQHAFGRMLRFWQTDRSHESPFLA